MLTKFAELICQVIVKWDEFLICDIICAADVKIILETPIREEFEDFLAWHYDGKGIFSIRSAYQVYIYKEPIHCYCGYIFRTCAGRCRLDEDLGAAMPTKGEVIPVEASLQ